MKRVVTLIAALALAVLTAAPAAATAYYVRSGGSNAQDGTSYAAAWGTIAKANATIAAGDVVYIYPGTYTDFPNPAAAGGDETHRFSYIGAHATLDPTADSVARHSVTIIGGTLSKPFVSLNGLRIAGSLTLGASARIDTLSFLHVTGPLDVGDADYCVFDRCTFSGVTFYMGASTGQHAIGNEFHGCNFWNLGARYGDAANVVQFGLSAAAAVTASVDSCVLRFNRFNVTLTKDGDPNSHAIVTYAMRDCAWRGNIINVANAHPTGRWGALILSDSTSRNLFDCDTLNATGTLTRVQLAAVSSMTGKTIGRNTIDSCWFRVPDCPADFTSGLNHVILTRSTFVGGGTGLKITRALGRNFIDHCTIASNSPAGGVVRITPNLPAWQDQTVLTNSILYSFAPGGNDCPGTSNYASALFVPVRSIDSVYYGGGSHSAHLRSEGNLYSYYGHSSACVGEVDTLGQRSIVYTTPWGDRHNAPRAYVAAVGTRAPWDSIWCVGCDDSSKYGSPRFRDSTYAAFDPTLGLNSKATAGDLAGTDIGAVAFAAQVSLVLGPSAYFSDYGVAQSFDLSIQNLGTAVLSITHITPGHSTVTAGQDTLSVGGLAVGIVPITFTPTGDGSAPGQVSVTITSNDPVKPSVVWPCYIDITGGGDNPPERRP